LKQREKSGVSQDFCTICLTASKPENGAVWATLSGELPPGGGLLSAKSPAFTGSHRCGGSIMNERLPETKPESATKKRDPRTKIFVWAFFLSLICGVTEFGQPLEDVIQSSRDSLRSHDASSDIVVVGLDDKTAAKFDGLQFSRRIDADLVKKLFELGAKRVFFDRAYADATTPKEDAIFAATLREYRGRVFLGSMSRTESKSHKYEEISPRPEFLKATDVTSLNGRTSPFGLSARLPLSGQFRGKQVPSMSGMLAGVQGNSSDWYRPDWSIRVLSIPTVSFADVIDRRVSRKLVQGRDIVVGPTAPSSNDYHRILMQGWLPGVYFHVVGAETLKRGQPVEWGWALGFLVATGLSIANLMARSRWVSGLSIVIAASVLGVLPLYFDARLVSVEVVPGALMFVIVAYRSMTLRRVERSSQTNVISGLPNLVALRQAGLNKTATLVALKIRNYAEIAASFDQLVERAVIDDIRRRISMSCVGNEIFHSEDTLLWYADLPMGEELAHHLEGLKAILGSALRIDDREIDISVSFGADGDPGRPVASRIGSAMLCAEEAANSNNILKFYDPTRRHEATWQLSLLGRLDHAVDNGELWVAYQPKLDLRSNSVFGAEALVRWTHPERGSIAPDDFIAVAEKHNRIEKLTSFVLDRAIQDAASLNGMGLDFTIAVNLSVQLLQMPGLLDLIDTILKKHNFQAHKLTLEITETGKLDRKGSSMATMRALAAHGINVSIDDYGTGNATLDYLKILPSNEVKIDRRFVADINRSEQDRILVSSTIEMAHSLGRIVVAEGVETQDVLNTLGELGCDVAQGYLIGRPVEFARLANDLAPAQRRAAM
jgi:diguanylate cyclase